MTLAAILVIYFFSLGGLDPAPQDQAAPQAQAPAASNTNPAPASSPTQQNSTQPAPKPKPHPHPARRKKVKTPDCATSSADAKSADGKTSSASSNPASAPANPCPPQKKIVKDGGMAEPTVQRKSDTQNTPDQVSTTEQLRATTEDNLKKIAGRELNASQQQTVDQIKLFMDQSKAAVAEGDLERGHNLAMKARLLSDELASP
jgi:hypothetical protein